MSSVKPWGGFETDEELGAICVWSSVGHRQLTSVQMLELQARHFVWELGAVDGLSTGAIVIGKVTSLSHESSDDSVEMAVRVSVALLIVSGAD